MFNKIILIGNLVKDPEVRFTAQGVPVGNFRLAVNSKFKQGEDSRKEETLFIDIITFGKQAETCGEYLNKGSSVLVDGRLQERRWESDGQQRSKFEVVANAVRFLNKTDKDAEKEDSDVPEDKHTLEPF